jgi:DNA topoisomerase-1
LQRGEGGEGNTASIPESVPPADLTLAKAVELLSKPQGPQTVAVDNETGLAITLRTGRFGPYLQLGEDSDTNKAKKVALTYGPKHVPISSSINIDQLTHEQTKQIISLPRAVGEISGKKVVASVGRFGPYLKMGDDYRSIPKDKDLLTITIDEATQIFAEEKKGRGRKKATVLRELGMDPVTKKPLQVLDGRYGPYISNGSRVFASVPKDMAIDSITILQAQELLANKKSKKTRKKKGE